MKTGVLLVNVGTPENPTPKGIRSFLRKFLMDPLVIDTPTIGRWILVNAIIIPKRSKIVASQYQTIWTKEGSPLLVQTVKLAKKIQNRLGDAYVVRVGMRYGPPSIGTALNEMIEHSIARLILFPLYPQYSLASTESAILETEKQLKLKQVQLPIHIIPPFYNLECFLDGQATLLKTHLEINSYDRLLFSFHGLPEHQVKKTDLTHKVCFVDPNCCDQIVDCNRNCYRAQCFETARQLAKRIGLSDEKYSVCFQSRLGTRPWIKPYTDELYRTLPKLGFHKLLVICPSFVTDCLETLEEVKVRGKREFQKHGGKELMLVRCLNSAEDWVESISHLVRETAYAAR